MQNFPALRAVGSIRFGNVYVVKINKVKLVNMKLSQIFRRFAPGDGGTLCSEKIPRKKGGSYLINWYFFFSFFFGRGGGGKGINQVESLISSLPQNNFTNYYEAAAGEKIPLHFNLLKYMSNSPPPPLKKRIREPPTHVIYARFSVKRFSKKPLYLDVTGRDPFLPI